MSQSLTKALILLKHLGKAPKGLGVRELARQAAFTPPTVHALLKSLQAQGFVDFDEVSRQYRLGLALVFLGGSVDRVAVLKAAVEPEMNALFASLGETIAAVAWLDGRGLVIHYRQSSHQLVIAMPDGEVSHPHQWASGLVLLAFQPPAVLDDYMLSRVAAGEENELRAKLEEVRSLGFAEAINVKGSAVAALGVPVFGSIGQVCLSLAVSAPLSRLSAERRHEALALMLAAAARVSQRLGGLV